MTNGTIVYDNQFNLNEWYVLLALCFGLVVMFVLPRRFPPKVTILIFAVGLTLGALSDHYIGTVPVSLYDTSDTSAFDWADIPSLFMYGPYSYLFFYILDYLNLLARYVPIYILLWAVISTGMEWLATRAGVFHYNHGYWLGISFAIYLIVHSMMIFIFTLIRHAAAEEC